jgi:hypothetical protein
MTPRERLATFLEENAPRIGLDDLRWPTGGGGNGAPSYLDELARDVGPHSSDEEIRRAILRHPPSGAFADRRAWAHTLGFFDFSDYLEHEERERERQKRERAEAIEAHEEQRHSLAFLSDIERELVEALDKIGRRPCRPEHCHDPALLGGRYADGSMYVGDEKAITTCARQLATLLSWHATDKPRGDLHRWVTRNYGAVIALPVEAMVADERLEELFAKFARPHP